MWDGVFEGKVACVCGGAVGIGGATSRAFAAAGARVVVADLDERAGEATVAEIGAAGGSASFVACDVSDERQVGALFEQLAERHGRLDVLHANAGIEWTRDLRHTSLEEWRRVIDVNLTGVFLVGRAGLEMMCGAGEGSIVVTSSPHALATVPDAGAYAASKGGVNALIRALALEAAPFGIRVNGLMPGTIDTPMVRREIQVASSPEVQLEKMAASHPLGRLGRAEEVAEAALYLASPAASFVSGAILSVDGGLMAGLPSGPPIAYGD